MSKPKAQSWRHHYVPKFHLKGFTKADGELCVFDKAYNKLKPGAFSPTSHFFEPNRNTVTHPGIDPDVVERYYGEYDSTVAGVFQRLRENPSPIVDLRLIQDLKCYISVLFWRLPESDQYLDAILPKLGFDKLGIRLVHPETREEIKWPEFEQIVLKDPDFRKGIRFLSVPLATFDLFVQQYDAVNWGLYRAPREKAEIRTSAQTIRLSLRDWLTPSSSSVTWLSPQIPIASCSIHPSARGPTGSIKTFG